MRLALAQFADNPIIDELVDNVDHNQAIQSLRACAPIWRKPFIEIEYRHVKKQHHIHFERDLFIYDWSSLWILKNNT